MELSFASKVSLTVALLLALSIATSATVSISVEKTRRIEEMINEKKSLNEVLAFSVESAEVHIWTWPYLVRKAAESEDVLYTRIVKPSGEIYLSNIEEERGMFINDPAIATNETVVKGDVYNEESIVVIVSPTYKGHTLWLGFSLNRIYAAINDLLIGTSMMALGIIAVGTLISYFVVSHLLSPIKKLTSLCGDISKGNFSVRSNVQSKDEIGTLSRTFDSMAGKLQEMQNEIRRSERLSAIGKLAAMVGHDLRNPLTGIAGATYYLKTKSGSETDKKSNEMLELIEKSIEYSDKIISDLLEYSREIQLEVTETTPKPIVKDALSLVQVPKNIQVSDATQTEPKMKVDVEKMKRVFINIMKNAIDAMPKGGKLTIKCKKLGASVEFAFTDTGVGITKDAMEKIWNPLFTTKAKGMGFGLSICKRIVKAHRGNISVESTVGKGTTFTVTIPIESKSKGGEKVWVNVPESLLSTTTKA